MEIRGDGSTSYGSILMTVIKKDQFFVAQMTLRNGFVSVQKSSQWDS